MTEQQAREMQIEIKVEKWTDRIDAQFMAGKLTQEQYDDEIKAISLWADNAYRYESTDLPRYKFQTTTCSVCGGEFGPGNHGFSNCENHKHLPRLS